MREGNRQYSTLYLTGRSLLPSAISAMICICFSIGFILVHLVLLSLVLGTIFPMSFDSQWGLIYTNYVVQPLTAISSSLTFSNAFAIGLWGLAGLVTYVIFELASDLIRDWREEETTVQVADTKIIPHPTRRSFITKVLWRAGVLATAIVVLILTQPILSALTSHNAQLISGSLTLADAVTKLVLELAGWAFAAHCFVVFLRLFLMRTRLFGDSEII